MSDEKPLPADSPNDDTSVDGLSENDLDALLAQASSLVDDIAEQVGPESFSPNQAALADEPTAAQSETGTPPPVDGGGLDAQLTELDALAQTTGAELGAAAPVADGQPAGEETSSAGVPDFMREFTEPAAEEASGGVSADTDLDSPTDGVAGTAAGTPLPLDDGLESVESPPVEQAGTESAESTDTADTAGDNKSAESPSRFAALATSFAGQANKAGLVSAELAISALTILDRPFAGLSENLKRLLGWVAISTTLTALIVLAITAI